MASISLMCPSRGNPYEGDDGVTKLQEDVGVLLEDAGLPQSIIDQIMLLVQTGEIVVVGLQDAPPAGVLEEARDAINFFDKVRCASAEEKIAVGTDHWDRLEKSLRQVVELLPDPRLDPVSGPIPQDVYWFAEHQNFYHTKTRRGMGEPFYMNWRRRYHEFPQGPPA